MRPRRHHQDTVEARDGDDPDHLGPLAATLAVRAAATGQQRCKRLVDLIDAAVFQGEDPHGHAGEHVHVEGRHHLEPAVQLRPGAGQHQQVADFIDPHKRGRVRHRLQDLGHIGRADILQRHDNSAETRALAARVLYTGSEFGAVGLPGYQVAAVAAAYHQHVVGLEQGLQHTEQLVPGDGRTGAQGDLAVDRLVDHVIQLQDVPHNRVHHFGQGRLLEIDTDVLAHEPDGLDHRRHLYLPVGTAKNGRVAGPLLVGSGLRQLGGGRGQGRRGIHPGFGLRRLPGGGDSG